MHMSVHVCDKAWVVGVYFLTYNDNDVCSHNTDDNNVTRFIIVDTELTLERISHLNYETIVQGFVINRAP